MKCQLIIVVSLVDDICTKVDGKMRHGHMQINYNHMTKSHKKLSCDRETSLCFDGGITGSRLRWSILTLCVTPQSGNQVSTSLGNSGLC